MSQFSDIGSFTKWLKQREHVSDVDYNPDVLLTTAPPQQWVSFSIEGKRYRFRLMKGLDVEVLSGSDRTVLKGKVVIVNEEGPKAKER